MCRLALPIPSTVASSRHPWFHPAHREGRQEKMRERLSQTFSNCFYTQLQQNILIRYVPQASKDFQGQKQHDQNVRLLYPQGTQLQPTSATAHLGARTPVYLLISLPG